MSLNEAFFVSEKLHEKKVKLPDGSEHILHFAEVEAFEFVRLRDRQDSEDESIRASAAVPLLARGVRNPDGSQAMTEEQVAKLKPAAARALMDALTEANSTDPKKNSPSAADDGSAAS